jgi:hypothetical protein
VSRRAIAAAAVAAAAAAGCGPGEVTLPTPPMQAETMQLLSVYEMPTGTIDTSNIDQVRADAQARLAQLNLDWLPDVLTDALARARQRLIDNGLPDDPAAAPSDSRFAQLTAVVTLHRICAGWNDPAGAPDEATNGAIDVTAIVDTGRLNPEIWGTATACRARFPPAMTTATAVVAPPMGTVVNATLDGTLIIYSLGPLPTGVGDARLLIVFNGMIGVDNQVASASFDFQIFDGSIKFRVPVASGGDAIVSVGTTLGIQGANASFSCDLTTLVCQAS